MGYYSDVYSSPEKHGLEIIFSMEDDDLSYEFDMFVVWVDKDGRVYYATDSGCSCPSPFEDVNSVNDLILAHDRASVLDAARQEDYSTVEDIDRLRTALVEIGF